MASTVTSVADAVLAIVRGLDLGIEFTAERVYGDYDDEASDREAALVEVLTPSEPAVDLDTRGGLSYTFDVIVTLRKRIIGTDRESQTGKLNTEQVDALIDAVERIADAMIPDVFAAVDASWLEVPSVLLFDPQQLRQMGQFIGQVTVRFEARKALA